MKRALLFLLALPSTVIAGEIPELPSTAQVERALREHPLVRAAEAGMRVEEANRDRLAAGPHEFALKLATQQRRDRPFDMGYHEHEIGIERALRLPGKAAADAGIGAAGVDQARAMLGDALHESGRQLLKGWFDWRRELAAVQEWQAQTAVLRRQQEVVARRVGAGDAARLEALLAEAQLAQAGAQLAQAETRCELAARELALRFPAIVLPERVTPPAPQPVDGTDEQWRERILEHNHELRAAVMAARRSRLLAQRLDAERVADPTLGLRLASERSGQERIVGVQVTIPLAGEARAAAARAGSAEADVAAAREALVRARVEAEARRTIAGARGAYRQWQLLADVARRMGDNAALLDKAWRLGEGQFADVQTARRQAIEARLAESQSRLDASEARYRLLLDTHELWGVDVPDGMH